MAGAKRRHKCRNCGVLFWPDPRNVNKQKYCSELDCRKASKSAAQRRWSGKKRNRNYFKGEVHARRVQEWRKQHPGYWRRTSSALQDHSTVKPTEKQSVTGASTWKPGYKILSVYYSGARTDHFSILHKFVPVYGG